MVSQPIAQDPAPGSEPLVGLQIRGIAASLLAEAIELSSDPANEKLTALLIRAGADLLGIRQWVNMVLEGGECVHTYQAPKPLPPPGSRVISLHTAACIEIRAHQAANRLEFERAFPAYCRQCQGHGTLGPDSCDHCLAAGLCPHCKHDVTFFTTGARCSSCDWREGDTGMPPEPDECLCNVTIYPDRKARRRNGK